MNGTPWPSRTLALLAVLIHTLGKFKPRQQRSTAWETNFRTDADSPAAPCWPKQDASLV